MCVQEGVMCGQGSGICALGVVMCVQESGDVCSRKW
jgi:hypothetical protein